MTNKINGIDVSECVHLDEWKHCNICKELVKTIPDRHQCVTEQDLRCEYYSDCYFKQLKRLQQENKRLNQELDIKEKMLDKFMIGSGEILEKLQQENEKLKKHCEEWALETVKMQGAIDGKDFKIDKYKQALEEIRENANLCFNMKTCLECPNCDKCDVGDEVIPAHDFCKLIKDKINEVLK